MDGKSQIVTEAVKLCQHGRKAPCDVCENPFYSEIWDIVHKKNRNVLILTEGPPGTGKSLLDCEIGHSLDPEGFNHETIQDRVVFNPKKFLEVLNSGKLYKGAFIMLEEFGIQDDHRQWHSINNKLINYIFQSFRLMNLIVVINVPVADYIDSDARKLFQFHIETVSVDFDRQRCKCRIKRQSYNSATKKIYRKYLRYNINGKWLKIDPWYVKKPYAKLSHAYEKLQMAFKMNLLGKLHREISMLEKSTEESETRKLINETEAAKFVLDNRQLFGAKERSGRPYVDQQLIESHFKVGRFIGLRIKRQAESHMTEEKIAKEKKAG